MWAEVITFDFVCLSSVASSSLSVVSCCSALLLLLVLLVGAVLLVLGLLHSLFNSFLKLVLAVLDFFFLLKIIGLGDVGYFIFAEFC